MLKGFLYAALELHQERLAVFEELEDRDGIAITLYDPAAIELQQKRLREAAGHLATSYDIFVKIGRLEGICAVGFAFGQLLCAAGHREEGLAILTRPRDGFLKLGKTDMARQTDGLINEFTEKAP